MHRGSVPLFWRRIKHRYQLVGVKCKTCGGVFYPPKPICPHCRREGELEEVKLRPTGKIVTFSIVRAPPKGFEKEAPYPIAIVELDDGPRLTTQIVDYEPEDLEIGRRVEACFRRIYVDGKEGIINYGLKFRPLKNDKSKKLEK